MAGGLLSLSPETRLGGTVRVADGATLGGTGRLEDVTLASGATLAPGHSLGTLEAGDITFEAGTGLDLAISDSTTLGLSYSGQLAPDARAHGFNVELSVRF